MKKRQAFAPVLTIGTHPELKDLVSPLLCGLMALTVSESVQKKWIKSRQQALKVFLQSAIPQQQLPLAPGTPTLFMKWVFFLVKNAQETPKKVGDKVAAGDVLCYVEAMKTYNAIRAEFDGTITAICANSGDSVSEDDVLMKVL